MNQEIQSQQRVLEDGDAALIEGSTDKAEDGIEYASLDEPVPAPAAEKPAETKPVAAKPAAAPAPAADDAEIPEEYKGKSVKDIIKMHKEAQSALGRQGSELGDLRKRADYAIQLGLEAAKRKQAPEPAPAAPAAPAPLDEAEFFAKPHDAVSKAIENHPKIKEILATLGQSAADSAKARAHAATERFNQAHPDSQEILADPEFRAWVMASNVRRDLLHRANARFDFEAGDEVFGTWKALKGTRKPAADAAPATPAAPAASAVSDAARTLAAAAAAKKAAATQAAAVPSGGASAGKGDGTGKKIYRRADVLRLMEEQPERYEAMADELTLAYKENRVR